MTSPPLHIPAQGTVVLAPSVRIFFSATIVVIGTATAALFLKNPTATQVVSAEIQTEKTFLVAEVKKTPAPVVSIASPQIDSGTGKIGQVYQAPEIPKLPIAITAMVPEIIPAENDKTVAHSSQSNEWKKLTNVNSDFKTIHTIPQPPNSDIDKPSKKIESRMEAPSMNELSDAMLTTFQFADNLREPSRANNHLPSDPFLSTEAVSELKPLLQTEKPSAEGDNPLRPLVQKETLFNLKPIRKIN